MTVSMGDTMKVYNILDRLNFLNEVATLEYEEWAENKEYNKEERIRQKIEKINKRLSEKDFCKLVLVDKDELIGFISIFPHDCDECIELTPWYATMYVKKKYRGRGYSRILNDEILKEAKQRNYKGIYLKTTLDNYYERFGAKFIKKLSNNEKIYKFNLL